MKTLRTRWAVVLALLVLVSACGGPTESDPYADPGTAPPPTITDPTITTSGSVARKVGQSDLLTLNIAGFSVESDDAALAPSALVPVDFLGAEDFTVVEAGVVQGITVERIATGSEAAADVAFVFDTTGSMGAALTSVQASIVDFANFLEASGLDVRLGAVTFGDAFDTKSLGSSRTGSSLQGLEPPSFDPLERPSFPLSTDFDAFKTFIEEDSPRGGNDTLENALGSLAFAFDTLGWRPGAQRILIVITDVCSHTADTASFIDAPWTPTTYEETLGRLKGRATVHVVSRLCTYGLDMGSFAGVSGTGGVYFEWDGSEFDLTSLPLAETAAGGYLVTYRGNLDGNEKDIRVVIDDGEDVRGEFTLTATY